jgi:hypothetical protein
MTLPRLLALAALAAVTISAFAQPGTLVARQEILPGRPVPDRLGIGSTGTFGAGSPTTVHRRPVPTVRSVPWT